MVRKKSEEEKKKKITLTIDRKIYSDFVEYCKERGMKASPKVEIMIKKELEKKCKLKSIYGIYQ